MAIEAHGPTAVLVPSPYPENAVPELVECLDELAERGVRHCSWKSNLHLAAGLAGETDLDLLVDRRDAPAFHEIVARHGLKPLVPAPDAAFPGMEHLLGFDAASGRLFHLHVHYQLVLGEKRTKNHRLPIERRLLDGTRVVDGVTVPRPELELSILAVRALLKYRLRDAVKDVLGVRSPGLPADLLAEFDWLRGQTTDGAMRDALRGIGDIVSPDLVRELLDTAVRAPRSGWALFRLRARLRRELRRHRRRGPVRATAAYLTTAWRRRSRPRLRTGPDRNMTPRGGGTTIALVGADGSGKSTLAEAVARWLGWKLETRLHYMGSKAPSRVTSWLYLAFRALRRGSRAAGRRLGPGSRTARSLAYGRDVALALHHLGVGRDRARRYREAQQDARAGRVVVFDRYPLERVSRRPEHRLLDGPHVSITLGRVAGLTTWLAAAEERIYRRFALPEHLAVLDVDPEIAALRKPDHRPDTIRAKSRAVIELGRLAEAAGARVVWIDANRPLDAVLLDVKARLWDAV